MTMERHDTVAMLLAAVFTVISFQHPMFISALESLGIMRAWFIIGVFFAEWVVTMGVVGALRMLFKKIRVLLEE